MFSESQFSTLFAYHWQTTDRLLKCAARLSEDDYFEHPGFGHGSIHDLFYHLLRVDLSWRKALEAGQQQSSIEADDYPSCQALQTGFDDERQAWQTLLESVDGEAIEGETDLTTWRGDTMTFSYWHILQHLVLHGMQHHAELAQLLTAKGQSPGDIDFIFYTSP